MKTEIFILLKNIIYLFFVIFIGYITYKKKIIDENVKDSISTLIVKITAPILLFTTISNTKFSINILHDVIILIISAFFIISFLILMGYVSAKIFKLEGKTKYSHIFCSSFGNTGFLAYPLLLALYGEKGIFYAASYNIMHDFLSWSLGVRLMNKHNGHNNGSGFLNPNSISILLGFLVFLIKGLFNLNDNIVIKFIYDAFNPLGKTTIYLSMLFIGCLLADVSFNKAFKTYSIYSIILIKMILLPISIMFFLSLFDINRFTKLIMVMQTAMPTATISSVLAYRYNSDSEYAVKSIMLTTSIALITLPSILYIFELLY
ncbi:AEC family transporter [Caldicellulosiruptoraceae bacterium PP1]